MSVTTELVRRYIESARSAPGMRAGMPKVTMCASIAERLCIEAESAQQGVTDEKITPLMRGAGMQAAWRWRKDEKGFEGGRGIDAIYKAMREALHSDKGDTQ